MNSPQRRIPRPTSARPPGVYSELVGVKLSKDMTRAIDRARKGQGWTRADWIRAAVTAVLADGGDGRMADWERRARLAEATLAKIAAEAKAAVP